MTAPLAPAPEAPPESAGMTVEELAAQIQAILDAATGEGRELTEDEVAQAEALEHKLATAQKRDREAQQRQVAEARRAALKARQAERLAPVNAGIMGMVAPAKPDHGLERAFNSYLRTGQPNGDIAHLRAQGEGTGSEGGYLVPPGFRDKLVERMKAFGGVANVVEEVTTDTGNVIEWPTNDDTGNVGEVVAEGGTFSSQADLTFGKKDLGAYMYMAGGGSATPLRLSFQLLQDAAFDVEGLVSRKLGERIARIQARHLVTGNGVHQPLGIVYGLTGVEMSSGGPTYDDLITWIHSVDPAYRGPNCRWAFNDTSLATIKKLKDSHGDPIWRPSNADMATGLEGGVLLGYPVTIDQAFGDIVGTNGADDNWGVFGDLREGYVTRRVKAITIIVNPWTRAANGQIEYTAWARMDATQQNTAAYTVMAGFTT